MRLGAVEIILIVFILLLVFGAGRLPGLANGIGKAIRSLKGEASGQDDKQDKPHS